MKGRHEPRRLELHTEGHRQQQLAPFKAWGGGQHRAWNISFHRLTTPSFTLSSVEPGMQYTRNPSLREVETTSVDVSSKPAWLS